MPKRTAAFFVNEKDRGNQSMTRGRLHGRKLLLIGALVLGLPGLFALLLMKPGPLPQAHASPERIPIGEPQPREARLAVLNSFDRFPVVALSEAHGMKEEAEFINDLI